MIDQSEPGAFRSVRVLDRADGLAVRSYPLSIGFGALTLVFTAALTWLAARGIFRGLASGNLGSAASSMGVLVVGAAGSGALTIFALSYRRLTITPEVLSQSWMLFGLPLRSRTFPLTGVRNVRCVTESRTGDEAAPVTFLEVAVDGRKLRLGSGEARELERLANLCNLKIKSLAKRAIDRDRPSRSV